MNPLGQPRREGRIDANELMSLRARARTHTYSRTQLIGLRAKCGGGRQCVCVCDDTRDLRMRHYCYGRPFAILARYETELAVAANERQSH